MSKSLFLKDMNEKSPSNEELYLYSQRRLSEWKQSIEKSQCHQDFG